MQVKLRLLFRYGIADSHGRYVAHHYKTEVVYLDAESNIFTAYETKIKDGWLPEVVGGEWIVEKETEA